MAQQLLKKIGKFQRPLEGVRHEPHVQLAVQQKGRAGFGVVKQQGEGGVQLLRLVFNVGRGGQHG